MRMSVGPYSNGLSEIVIEHGEESLSFKGSTYNRTRFSEPAEHFFDDINGFWGELPFGQQSAIWAVYKKIDQVFSTVHNSKQTYQTLHALVQELCELHSMERLNYWIRMRSQVKYPPGLQTEYSPEFPKEMTYLRTDYEGLLTLTLSLRIVLPVFSRYMMSAEKESGGQFKEYLALALLENTDIMRSPYMERLRSYVVSAATIDENKPSLAAILGGLGTSQLPRYYLAQAVIRRVAVSEMKTTGDPINIISNVWNFISSGSKDIDKKFGGPTKDKNVSESGGEDDRQSIVENYKIKTEIPEATTVTDTVFVGGYLNASMVDPTIDVAMVSRLWNHHRILTTFTPSDFQLALAGWVLAPVVSARAIDYLEPAELPKALVVAQGLLWHWGFPDLAALMTAVRSPTTMDMSEVTYMSKQWKSASAGMLATLDEQYPHWKRLSKKQLGRTPDSNYALQDVRDVFQEITAVNWDLKCPRDLLSQVTMAEYDTGFEAPNDLEHQLVDFIIKNNNRKHQAGV